MHTEHLENIRATWVIAGWLVAAAVTSLIALVVVALEIAGPEGVTGSLWGVISVALGFWVGGFFTGFRALRAPILHGIMIGLTSLVVWFLVNILTLLFDPYLWQALSPALTAGLLLIQMMAAVAGTWVGHRVALRGGIELME